MPHLQPEPEPIYQYAILIPFGHFPLKMLLSLYKIVYNERISSKTIFVATCAHLLWLTSTIFATEPITNPI